MYSFSTLSKSDDNIFKISKWRFFFVFLPHLSVVAFFACRDQSDNFIRKFNKTLGIFRPLSNAGSTSCSNWYPQRLEIRVRLLLHLHLQPWPLAPFCSSGAHCLKWCMAKILTNVQKWVMSSSCKQNAIVVVLVSVVVPAVVVAYSAWSHYLLLTFSCTRRPRHLCSCCCCSFYYP